MIQSYLLANSVIKNFLKLIKEIGNTENNSNPDVHLTT